MIDAGGRTVIPGLNDSHIHVIRGGLNYDMELRWDGVPSLADALSMLRRAGRPHAGAAMGARGRRLDRVPVRGAAHADPRRDQCGCAGRPGLRPPPLRPGAAEPRRAARRGLHARDARPAGWRDPARQGRESDRSARRPAEREHSLQDALARAPTRPRRAADLHAALHARAQPLRTDQHHRRRRGLPELP